MRALILMAAVLAATPAASAERWTSLFNGRDLSGWTPKINHHPAGENWRDTFGVKDGAIRVSYAKYDRFTDEFGHLVYKTPYSSYRLRFEYRFTGPPPPGTPGWAVRNSGVMLHGPAANAMGLDQPYPVSIEAQFLGVVPGEARTTGNVCTPGVSVVMAGQPLKIHCKNSTFASLPDGEWAKFEVEVHGGRLVRQFVNGQLTMEYGDLMLDPTEYKRFANVDPGDTKVAPLTSGYLSLQAEGSPVEFRRIEILKLKD